MKRTVALILVLLLTLCLFAGCAKSGGSTQAPASTPASGGSASSGSSAPSGGSSDAPAVTDANAPSRTDAGQVWAAGYAKIDEIAAQAAAYDKNAAKYKFTCNCHDPLNSAPGEFLTAWSNAVLAATEGQVYIDIGVSNAYCTDGTMATLDQMEAGAIDFDWTLPCYFGGYMPLTLVIQNPALGIKNATAGSYAMWELYKNNAAVQAEYEDDGKLLFVWCNNPSPLSYKGDHEVTSVSEVKGNIRGNKGPAQMFVNQVGATIYGCPIGDVYTNVSTGVINYLITDWHGIASFNLYDDGELNYYVDTNIGCSAYCLMANSNVWAGLSDDLKAKIESVSGDYLLDLVCIWEYWEALGRYNASKLGDIYAPAGTFAEELNTAYEAVAKQWISENGSEAQAVYDQAKTLVEKYNAIYG